MNSGISVIVKRTKQVLSPIYRRMHSRIHDRMMRIKNGTRHPLPYATHIPILLGLARLVEIRQVVEFGAGTYSTLTFLNKVGFPELTSLISFEDDPAWAKSIGSATQNDTRCSIKYTDQAMSLASQAADFGKVDLIFIDSQSVIERSKTIKSIVNRYAGNGIIVIHDYERRQYQEAALLAPYSFRFSALNPQTGVLWLKRDLLNRQELKRLNGLIRLHSKVIQPDDIAGWDLVYRQHD